jgi:hypothetical protein
MAQTLPDYIIGNTWVSLNNLTGVAAGTALKIQNKSTTWVTLQESNTQPTAEDTKGELVTDLFHTEPSKIIAAGSLEIWAKSTIEGRNATISVQTI